MDGHRRVQFHRARWHSQIKEGDWITIDGTEGVVYQGKLEVEKQQRFPKISDHA